MLRRRGSTLDRELNQMLRSHLLDRELQALAEGVNFYKESKKSQWRGSVFRQRVRCHSGAGQFFFLELDATAEWVNFLTES